ncbi:eCIS core domain-containing protein [Micromonospora sp. CPCC 206061]|uniref:eCIS core domain-containing protein n=1 Tax=Micromonospora sp. CPCC 206061 TaxID=3122410 RepID=UPI002FEEB015
MAANGISGSPSSSVAAVPIHDGPTSHAAAARMGVHAYTFRGQVALGAGLDEQGGPGRDATIDHELVHAQQMRAGGLVVSAADAESAAVRGDHRVRVDPDTPQGLFWLIPVAVGAYILLRPNVANAPSPADVKAGRVQPSVSELQVAGEALALFAVPGGVSTALARAGYGVVTAMALGGAASSISFRGVQDVGGGEFSGVEAYIVDAATGAVIGAVIGGAVRIYGGPQALGAPSAKPDLVHFTTVESQQAILATSESGQAIGQLSGRTGIWALTDDALGQAPWVRATRATMPVKTAQAAVPIPPAAAGQFSRAVPLGPVSAYQYAMGVYRAPAGAVSMATGEFTAAGGMFANIRGLIFPYGADAAIWISAAALSGPPSGTADERGIRTLLPSLPPLLRPAIEQQSSMTESTRSDGPFVVLPNMISAEAAIAGANGSYDPVAQVCYAPEPATDEAQSLTMPAAPPAIIYVAPFWPTSTGGE